MARTPGSIGDKPVVVSLKFIDASSTLSFHFDLSGDHAVKLIKFLAEMTKLTWSQVWAQETGGRNRHKKHHVQAVDTLCKEAQDRFATLRLGETFGEDMFRFRLDSGGRLWGCVRDGVFYPVWWDPDHEVYPTDP